MSEQDEHPAVVVQARVATASAAVGPENDPGEATAEALVWLAEHGAINVGPEENEAQS